MVSSVLSVLFAIVVIFPLIVTLMTLIIYKTKGRAPVTVLGEAADWTTPFLFISVYIVADAIFEHNIGFYMMILFVSLGIIFAIYERLKVKDFRIIRLLRRTWRVYFMFLLFVYIGLLTTGLILKIIEYAH